VEVLGRSYLDAKRCVYLLKVGSRALVVGSSESGLACLSEIADPGEADRLAAVARSGSPGGEPERAAFPAALRRKLSRLVAAGGWRSRSEASEDDLAAEEGAGGASATAADEVAPAGLRAAGRQGDGEFEELRSRVEGLKARLRAIS
jgi:hypothetical protein